MNYIGKVNQIVWSVDPRELRELNIQKLVEMGIDQDLVVEAFDNPNLSPTHQTILVNTIEALAGAGSWRRMTSIWPNWFLLAILCILLTTGWFIRRSIGLV